jgi:hypothetical protein
MTLYGYITLKEAERISGISVEALKKQCQTGRLRGAVKEAGSWFVPRGEIVVEPGHPEDDALGLLIIMAEAAGVGTGVTVYVNGLVIEGRLISAEKYVAYMRQNTKVTLGIDTKTQETLDKAMSAWYKNILEKEVKAGHFLHLEHVSVRQGGGDYEPRGALLRLRLDSIDGFQLGTIKTFPDKSITKDEREEV